MNEMQLAVAGGRKTQSIVDHCCGANSNDRILILTYTMANQAEVRARLARHGPPSAQTDVMGWFSFLMAHWIRPYLPQRFPTRKLRGLNFEGDPDRHLTGEPRFLDSEGRAYKRHLAKLAVLVNLSSNGAVLDRLSRIYDRIWIDEVQDLNGHDLVVLEALMDSPIELRLVGDVRQAILDTNVRDPKYKQYRGVKIKDWIDLHERKGHLTITYASITWRSNQEIANFADSIFPPERGFAPTISENTRRTGHDGLYAIDLQHAAAYFKRFRPLCLRYNANSGKSVDLPFVNIGAAKGLDVERVALFPTGQMAAFIEKAKPLADGAACSLYVAVTRARASVAFLAESPERLGFRTWRP